MEVKELSGFTCEVRLTEPEVRAFCRLHDRMEQRDYKRYGLSKEEGDLIFGIWMELIQLVRTHDFKNGVYDGCLT